MVFPLAFSQNPSKRDSLEQHIRSPVPERFHAHASGTCIHTREGGGKRRRTMVKKLLKVTAATGARAAKRGRARARLLPFFLFRASSSSSFIRPKSPRGRHHLTSCSSPVTTSHHQSSPVSPPSTDNQVHLPYLANSCFFGFITSNRNVRTDARY